MEMPKVINDYLYKKFRFGSIDIFAQVATRSKSNIKLRTMKLEED